MDIIPGPSGSGPTALRDFQGELFFWARTPATGDEPWISDGTAAGTQMLADIYPGTTASGYDEQGSEIGGWLYFRARDPIHGSELWRTDGTPAGTSLFLDFDPGPDDSFPFAFEHGGRMFVAARTAALGEELWVSDGTPAGTQLLVDLAPGPADGVGYLLGRQFSSLLFAGDDSVHGVELWVTDGTPAGTALVKDIKPGPADGVTLGGSVIWGNLLFFSAKDGVNGNELWATDGTSAGTYMVRDIQPGQGSSNPVLWNAAIINNGVVFMAQSAGYGVEPWITDGTPAGTFLLQDIEPGPNTSQPLLIRAAGPNAVVIGADSASYGFEPWISDGTVAGTQVVDLLPGSASSSYPTNQLFLSAAGRVFFPCQLSGTGYELGASDGTVAGTQQVKDLFAGSSTLIFGIRPVAGDDDFVLVDHDFRLAYSNGIAATTQLVPQDPTLPTIRTIYEAVRIGDRIFMAADRDDVDSELFALRVDGDGDGVIEYFDTLNVEIGCTCDVGFAPCGNSDPSAGCANSTGFGARLDGSGSTVLGADDLLLSVARMPAFANGLVFVGDTSMPPVPFADGLRCIASPTSRYALKNAGAGGTFSYGPGLAAQSLSLPSSLQFIAGRTLRFQAWYRDGGGPCGSGSNLSNSASATFTP